MVLRVIEPMSYENLEKVLSILGKPDRFCACIFGDVSYADLTKQIEKIYPGVCVKGPRENTFVLEADTDKILELYKKYIESERTSDAKNQIHIQPVSF